MKRKALPALSRAETEILRLIWQLKGGTVQDVCDRLPKRRRIAYATVQTLLRRLEAKGYIAHSTQGKAYVYRSAVRPERVVRTTVKDFVDRLFGGDPVPLMLHLADQTDLDDEAIRRLKELIAEDDD